MTTNQTASIAQVRDFLLQTLPLSYKIGIAGSSVLYPNTANDIDVFLLEGAPMLSRAFHYGSQLVGSASDYDTESTASCIKQVRKLTIMGQQVHLIYSKHKTITECLASFDYPPHAYWLGDIGPQPHLMCVAASAPFDAMAKPPKSASNFACARWNKFHKRYMQASVADLAAGLKMSTLATQLPTPSGNNKLSGLTFDSTSGNSCAC